jgi:HK97 family phage major capsid protein
MAPDVAELLRKREAATGSGFLIDGNGRMLNFPVHVSNSIDAGTIFCGDFAQIVVMVKDIELLIDKSTGSISGLTNVLAYPFMDVVVTRPSSFAVATGTT